MMGGHRGQLMHRGSKVAALLHVIEAEHVAQNRLPVVATEVTAYSPRRLISLRDACLRRGISVRSYWRDTSQLPPPVRGRGKHLFLEQEVEQLIDELLAARQRHPGN